MPFVANQPNLSGDGGGHAGGLEGLAGGGEEGQALASYHEGLDIRRSLTPNTARWHFMGRLRLVSYFL